jgi:hypothetical protein
MSCVVKFLEFHPYFSLHRLTSREFPEFREAFIWLFENEFPRTAFETEHVRFFDPKMFEFLKYTCDDGGHTLTAAKKYAKSIGMINPETGFAEPDFCYNKRDGYVPPPESNCCVRKEPLPPYDGPPALWLMDHDGWKVGW